jgi:hypothetical protein
MLRRTHAIFLAAALATASSVSAQISLTAPAGSLSENFDGLSALGTANNATSQAWTDGVTVPGWYASRGGGSGAAGSYNAVGIRLNDGSANSGLLYSYGENGGLTGAERALGSTGSGTSGTNAIALVLTNNTGLSIDTFTINYTGEQWRRGTATADRLEFDYAAFSSFSSLSFNRFDPVYTKVTALNYNTTNLAATINTALNGNDGANRTTGITGLVTLSTPVPAGASLVLRWTDLNDTGNDDGLAIDDFSFSYTTAAPLPFNSLLWDANTSLAGAQDGNGTWTNGSNNFIETSNNTQATFSNTGANRVTFGAGGLGSQTVTATDGLVAQSIAFAQGTAYTLTGGSVNLSGNDLTNALVVAEFTNANIATTINNTAPVLYSVANGGTLAIQGTISGSSFTKTGPGTLNLSGATNTVAGFAVDGGTVIVSADSNLGADNSAVNVNSGTIKIVNDIAFPGPGGGSGRTFTSSGTGLTFDTNGFNATIGGDLTGTGALIKTGGGTLTLATGSEDPVAQRYNGNTTIAQGAIRLTGFSSSGGGLQFSGLGSATATINTGAELIIDNIEFGSPTATTALSLVMQNGATITATGNSTGGSLGLPSFGRSDNALRVPNNPSATPGQVTIRTLADSDQLVIRSFIRQDIALTGSPTVGNGETDTNTTIIIDGPGRTVLTTGARFTQTTAFAGSWEVRDGMLQVGPVEAGGYGGRLSNTNVTENVDDDNDPNTPPVSQSFAVSGGDRFGEPLNALGSKLGLGGSSTTFADYVGNVVTVTNKSSNPASSAILALAVADKNPLLDARQSEPGQQYGAPALNSGGNFIDDVPAYFPNPIVLAGGAVAPAGFAPITLNDVNGNDILVIDIGKPTNVPVVGRIGGDLTINAPVNGSGGADSRVMLFDPTGISGAGERQVQVVGSGDTNWNSRLVLDAGSATGGIFLLERGDDILGTPAVTVGTNAELVVPAGTTFSYAGKNATYDNTAIAGVSLNLTGATVVLGTLTDGVAGFGNVTLSGSNLIEANSNDIVFNYTGESPIGTLINEWLIGGLTADGSFNDLPTYLAIAEAADLGLTEFSGLTVDETTVLVKYTYVGDANLDGQVDALDYERIDLAIGNSGVFGTAQGDLNYDGTVDALDYEQVDLNIGNGVGSPLAGVFIPEPASLSLVALGAGLLGRRRRA